MTTSSVSKRPLSPHLQVYRPQITSVMSITHRATGVALSIGTLVLVAWLWSAAYSPDYFNFWQHIATKWWAHVVLSGWTFAIYYHLANGIRHLFWDMGKGFSLTNVTRSGLVVLLFATASTVITWSVITHSITGRYPYEILQ